jgi:hypothetical protein
MIEAYQKMYDSTTTICSQSKTDCGIGEYRMSLNKAKGNMYSFITHTWNVIKDNLKRIIGRENM